MIRFGNDLARQATKSIAGCLVASSVGCYGAHLANGSEFCGRYGLSTLELVDWHKAKWTAHCTADLIACETIPCLAEVKALVSIIGSYEGELNGWISMSCQSGQLLNSGDSIEDACRALEDLSSTSEHNLRYLGLGINCSSPEIVEEALLCMQEHCRRGRPLVAYPNKGEPWDAVAKCYDASKGFSPQSFASLAVRWKEAGARVIGGCCRTDHVFTRALRQRLCIDEGNT